MVELATVITIVSVLSGMFLAGSICIIIWRTRVAIKRIDEKSKALDQAIEDAELMINELNSISDYITTTMEIKSEEMNLTIREAENRLGQIRRNQPMFKEMPAAVRVTAAQGDDSHETGSEPEQGEENDDSPEMVAFAHEASDLQGMVLPYKGAKRGRKPGTKNRKTLLMEEAAAAQSDKVIPIASRYKEVISLSKTGMNDTEIARKLNIGKGEIQLILGMNR